jgi:hypothetical protein
MDGAAFIAQLGLGTRAELVRRAVEHGPRAAWIRGISDPPMGRTTDEKRRAQA